MPGSSSPTGGGGPAVVAYTPTWHEELDDVVPASFGIRRRAMSESSPPTQDREMLSSGARQSVEFLLCEVLDDIVNLSGDAIDEESSQGSDSEVFPELPRHRARFHPWRSLSVIGGMTFGVFVTVLLR